MISGSYGSLKVIGNSDIRYSAYEFLLAFHSNYRKKGKVAYLYSAFYILCISQSAQAWITHLPANTPTCLPFLRMRSPDGATSEVRDI